jgi:hypothetical protein
MAGWRSLPAREVFAELDGDLARRIIVRVDNPPIRDLYQALLYRMSADKVHQMASEGWQLTHTGEMQALQAQHPGIERLREPIREETGGYRTGGVRPCASIYQRARWPQLRFNRVAEEPRP